MYCKCESCLKQMIDFYVIDYFGQQFTFCAECYLWAMRILNVWGTAKPQHELCPRGNCTL